MKPAPLLSAAGLLQRAVLLMVAYLICHAAGLREFTSFLSGTYSLPGSPAGLSALFGVIYLVFYLGFIFFAPAFLLAAGLLWLWDKKRGLRAPPRSQSTIP